MLNLDETAAILREIDNIERCELSLVALRDCILDIPDYKINLRRAALAPEEKRLHTTYMNGYQNRSLKLQSGNNHGNCY